jgi:hypothetical protein
VGLEDGEGEAAGVAGVPATDAGALGEPPPQAVRRQSAPRAACAVEIRVIGTISSCPKHETVSSEGR